jgi:GNAT superfamily N-acetyltransferase
MVDSVVMATSMRHLEFRELNRAEIDQIWTIDRREHIANIYRLVDGGLQLEAHDFDVPGWHPDNVANTTPVLREMFDRGARFFASFDGEQLAGVSVLDTLPRGERGDLRQLELLHVGRDYRGHGLGSRLLEQARAAARKSSARGLYISATPSENTIRFYQRRGATVLAVPDPELFALEPEDIHLECPV